MMSYMKTNDLVSDLKTICYANTEVYRSDFDSDVEIILAEAKKPVPERKTLLWLSYPCGTRIFFEEDVFLKDSPEYTTWLYYSEQEGDGVVAAALIIDDLEDEKVSGTIIRFDYEKHCERVRQRAVPASNREYVYENGSVICPCGSSVDAAEVKHLGKILYTRCIADEPEKLRLVLNTESLMRRELVTTEIKMEAAYRLELQWQKDKESLLNGEESLCLRCGNVLEKQITHNSLSRYVDACICSKCGTDEGLREWTGEALPLREWKGYSHDNEDTLDLLVLKSCCSFKDVFKKKDVVTGALFSEVAYARSDYDGYRWWTSWFTRGDKVESPLSTEIDGFMDNLFRMPEFKNLKSMRRACVNAGPTGDPTEWNLYSETYSFYIWIRMITRERDYNLYVHFLRKEQV